MLYPITPKHSPGKDTFAYWENFLSPEDIQFLLTLPHWDQLSDGSIGGNSETNSVNKKIRKSEVAWLNYTPETAHIWEKISKTFSEVNQRFFKFNLTGFYEPFQLGLYTGEQNGFYDWHTDMSVTDTNCPRKLSMALLLSDPNEFEGGNLELKTENDYPKTVEQKQGRAWFFPSYTLHRVTPVTQGQRKSLVVWVGGPEFK